MKQNNDINEEYYYELDFDLSKENKELLDKATKSDTNGYLVIIFNKMLKIK